MQNDQESGVLYLSRYPVGERLGVYKLHQLINEAVGRDSRPLWRRCPGYAIVLSPVPIADCPTRPYEPSPQAGQITRFDLLAEVSVARIREGSARGKRVDPILEARFANPARTYASLAREIGFEWLARQGDRHGFELLDLAQADYEVIEFVRKGQPVRLGAVRFAGRLRVTDPDKLRDAMGNGIGHSKAWGCGLLLCFGE